MDVDEEPVRRPRRERRIRSGSPSTTSPSNSTETHTYSSRRSRRTYNDDDDDDSDRRTRRSRKADDDEETTTRSTRRNRRNEDDDDDDSSSRRSRRKGGDDDEDEAPSRSSRSAVTISTGSSSTKSTKSVSMGSTIKGMTDARRKRVQQSIIDGMTKYAEQKFGRKKAAPKGGKQRSAMDDYEIYLRSVRSKVKTSQDRLNGILKQKKDIDEKVRKAEQEVEKQEKIFNDAEDEKKKAAREGRDPDLPSGFVVPQTAKKAVAGAGFANLVMKASAQLWEDKFMAMRAKKGGSEGQPEWMNKSKRSDKILLNVGKKTGHKKDDEQKPSWGANLKKSEPRRKTEKKNDDNEKAAFANFSLRKTAKKEEDDEGGSKKVDWKEMEKKTSTSSGGSRRRRGGGDDSD